ncbi:MAG: hypothetical protein N2170_00190 [Bacteroidia bacterium]|nr:hypothetical protein [Bacteroidia bacterium]
MPISVLLTESYHPTLLESLRQWTDISFIHLPHPTLEELQAHLRHTTAWILRGQFPVTPSLLEYAPHLQVIIRAGSGTEHIDKEALAQRKITLLSTPHANAASVAEYVVGALLALAHRMLPAHHFLREQDAWLRKEHIGREIASLTIGLIGFGHTGSRTAFLLKQLGAEVLVYDKYKSGFGGQGIVEVPLETLWERVDVLSLHIPLTQETQKWIDQTFLSRFRRRIALINTSRGGIISLPALASALQEGTIWGAALDTFPVEPPYTLSAAEREAWTYLRNHPAVLLTPHIAGLTEESELRLAQSVLGALHSFLHRYPHP